MATNYFPAARKSRSASQRLAQKKPPVEPLVGIIDLTPYSADTNTDKSEAEDGLVSEISAFVRTGQYFYGLTSGGSNRFTLTDWTTPQVPQYLEQVDLGAFFSTSVASYGRRVALAVTPESYDAASLSPMPQSQVNFYRLLSPNKSDPGPSLEEVGVVSTGYLTDFVGFRPNGKQAYAGNEAQPNSDYSQDPPGSVTIISIKGSAANPRFDSAQVALPELDAPGLMLQGSGIRYSGKDTVTQTFAQSAEVEYLSAAGRYLFGTLQESNTVFCLDLRSNTVESYIGLGWLDYSQVSVDLTDQDVNNGTAASNGFNPIVGQKVVGLRMPDAIAAWKQGKSYYFLTANEGDARDYSGYLDERRDSSLGYADVPGRLKLIVENAAVAGLKDKALTINTAATGDEDPTNDFIFESPGRTGTPVSFGSRSISLFDGLTGELLWDSWMADLIGGQTYNTSLQNIAEYAGVYDDSRSDDKGTESETVVLVEHSGRRYAVAALERTNAGDAADQVIEGGLLVVYDVTDVRNVDFVTFQTVSRSPEGVVEISPADSPTGRRLLGVSSEYNSNTVELLDFGAILNNGNGSNYLMSSYADPTLYPTL